MRKHTCQKLILSLTAIILLLFAAESALRIAGYHGPGADPYESFVLHRPLFHPEGRRMVVHPSRQRFFHPQEFELEKNDGTLRFFAFGGSVTYGYGLENPAKESYVHRLGEKLRDGGFARHVDAVNCGGICYASYRLVDLVGESLSYSPDFVVIMTGHNEFLEPRHYSAWMKEDAGNEIWWSRLRVVQLFLSAAGRLRTIETTTGSREDPDVMVLAPEYIGERYIVRDEKEYQYTLEHYTRNVNRMIDMCTSRGVPVLLLTIPSNLRDWPPFRTEPTDETLTQRFSEIQEMIRSKRFPEALTAARKVLEDHPRAAHFHYAAAVSLDELSRPAEAKIHYLLAKDTDAFPHRALSTFNERIREIAAEKDVLLYDAEADFMEASPDGIPGANLFLDQCHPNPEGHERLAEGILAVVRRHQLLAGRETVPTRSDSP